MNRESLTRADYCAQCGDNHVAVHLPWAHAYVIGCPRCGATAETVEEIDLEVLPIEQGERLWARLQRLLARGGAGGEMTDERREWRLGDTLNVPHAT